MQKLSPKVGELDAAAVAQELDRDPDATLELLAAMTRATDERLRAKARGLAAKLLPPVAAPRHDDPYGAGRLITQAGEAVDLDLDATLEQLGEHLNPRPRTCVGGPGRSRPAATRSRSTPRVPPPESR